MSKLTISLPKMLLNSLDDKALQLDIPMSELIEKAVLHYLDQLNQAEYIQTYQRMAEDIDMMNLTEEGLADFLDQLS